MIEMCRGLPNFADLIFANPFLKGDDIYQNMQRWLFVYNSGNLYKQNNWTMQLNGNRDSLSM